MKTLTEDQAAKYALRGEHIILEVYGQGVDGPVEISLVVDRKDVAAFINEFKQYFPKRDPVDMAKETLRTLVSVAGVFPPHAQFSVIGPALVLANSAPGGIKDVLAIEITVRENDVQVELFGLGNLETSKTVH